MKMKLWVDDERNAPDDTWLVARTSKDAKAFLYLNASESIEDSTAAFTHISLDHDLGGEDTGMMVLDYMIRMRLWPTEELTIHTMNPPARKRMLQAAAMEAPIELAITFITKHNV